MHRYRDLAPACYASDMAGKKRMNDDQRLAALHAVGLFQALDIAMVKRAQSYERCSRLSRAIEHNARLEPLVTTELRPAELGLDRLLVPCAGRYLRLTEGPDAGIYEPERPVALGKSPYEAMLALVNAALEQAGDPRRYLALRLPDPKDALFLLATPEQARVVNELDLTDEVIDPSEIPLPVELDDVLDQVAENLGRRLPAGVPPPEVTETEIELRLSQDGIAALLEALYASQYHRICRTQERA